MSLQAVLQISMIQNEKSYKQYNALTLLLRQLLCLTTRYYIDIEIYITKNCLIVFGVGSILNKCEPWRATVKNFLYTNINILRKKSFIKTYLWVPNLVWLFWDNLALGSVYDQILVLKFGTNRKTRPEVFKIFTIISFDHPIIGELCNIFANAPQPMLYQLKSSTVENF